MNDTSRADVVEIDLARVFAGIWRSRSLIILSTLVFALAGLAMALMSPAILTASRKVTAEYPFTVAARERCGFGASLAIYNCAADFFADELGAEVRRSHPDQNIQVRTVAGLGATKASQLGEFVVSTKSTYRFYDSGAKSAEEKRIRESAIWNFGPALDDLRTRYLSDAALFMKALADIDVEGVRRSETYATQLTAVRQANARLESGWPRVIGADPIIFETSHGVRGMLRPIIYWASLGMVLSCVFLTFREICRQFNAA